MEDLAKDLINPVIQFAKAVNDLLRTVSELDREMQEKKRRAELKKGSIDAEYRVMHDR